MSLSGFAAKKIANNSGSELNTIVAISLVAFAFGAFMIYSGYKGLQNNKAKVKFGVKLQGDKANLFNKFKIAIGVFAILKFSWMLLAYFV